MNSNPEKAESLYRLRGGEWTQVVLLFLIGVVLRLYNLRDNPPGLFRDEVEKGYTAFELIHTGRHGVLGAEGVVSSRYLPLFIEVFEGHDRTSAIYQYVAAPFVGVFGLSVLTTRISAAIAGILLMVAVWLYARRNLGAFSAMISLAAIAMHPTAILFSRWAQQGIFSILFAVAGFLALSELPRADPRYRRALGAVGGGVLLLACYSYDPVRLVVPLLIVAFLLTRGRAFLREQGIPLLLGAVIFAAGWIPLLLFTLGEGSARLGRVSVLSLGIGPGLSQAVGNYLAHFNPHYFVVSGDANPRHSLPGGGFMAPGAAFLMLFGLVGVLWNRNAGETRRHEGYFLMAWFLLAPSAAALTNEGIPHALRSGLMIPATALLAGYGSAWIACRVSRRWLMTFLWLVALMDPFLVWGRLEKLKTERPNAWEAGVLEAVESALETPGTPYLAGSVAYAPFFALFAEATDPALYQAKGLGALRTVILPPGQIPDLAEGDAFAGPPQPGLPIGMMDSLLVVYEMQRGEVTVLVPGDSE